MSSIRLWERKKRSFSCIYFIPLLCAFYLPSTQGATGPLHSCSVAVKCFCHVVCWNRTKKRRNPACLTWVQRVLYNVKLCRRKFISLDCIQQGDSKSPCVYGNMFVWINSRKRGLFQVCIRSLCLTRRAAVSRVRWFARFEKIWRSFLWSKRDFSQWLLRFCLFTHQN